MSKLILVRHGESLWNKENKFTGWVDVLLSEKGIKEAMECSEKLKDIEIDIAFTSKLTRAQTTLFLILSKQKKIGIFSHLNDKVGNEKSENRAKSNNEIIIFSSHKLNERYYGDLQGLNKDETKKKYGEDQVHIWRRSYDIQPPNGESLKDTLERTIPYFEKNIVPHLDNGKNVIVTAHGNSLRSIMKKIEGIGDSEITKLELETGKPVIYDFENGVFNKL